VRTYRSARGRPRSPGRPRRSRTSPCWEQASVARLAAEFVHLLDAGLDVLDVEVGPWAALGADRGAALVVDASHVVRRGRSGRPVRRTSGRAGAGGRAPEAPRFAPGRTAGARQKPSRAPAIPREAMGEEAALAADPRLLPASPELGRPACHAGGRGSSPVAPVKAPANWHVLLSPSVRPRRFRAANGSNRLRKESLLTRSCARSRGWPLYRTQSWLSRIPNTG
jgi:hypothetical protein